MEKVVFDDVTKRLIEVALLIYIASIIFLSYISGSDFVMVFIGTLPLLLYLMIFFMFFFYRVLSNWIVWLLPLFFPLMFFFLWQSGNVDILNRMEGPTLMVLNIIISYLANMLFILFYNKKTKEHKESLVRQQKHHENREHEIHRLRNTIEHYKKQLSITQENFNINLRSIEDKCKALNFVIGRVYSNKNGGSKDIRERLKINRELYNSFSELTRDLRKQNSLQLIKLLETIHNKLIILEQPEERIIDLRKSSGAQIKRRQGDRILDVLSKNDKDPVIEYYSEAKEICVKLTNFIKNKNLR